MYTKFDWQINPISLSISKDQEYTVKPLKVKRLGGRDPTTGRKVVKTVGGGNEKLYRWVDFKRHAPENGTFREKVYNVRYDPFYSNLIALVANKGDKRWIVASEFTKPGDVITTHNYLPEFPIKGERIRVCD